MKKTPTPTPAPAHKFVVGDRVLTLDGKTAAPVVAVYPIDGREASLLVWRLPSGRYEMLDDDQVTLVEAAGVAECEDLEAGDIVTDLDGNGRATVSAVLKMREGPPLVVIDSIGFGGYRVAAATLLRFVDPPKIYRRHSRPDYRLLDQLVGAPDMKDAHENARPTLPLMRAALSRVTLAMELAHRACSLIREMHDDPERIGWRWTEDEYTAARAAGFCQCAERELESLLASCVSIIAYHENDAFEEVTP